MKRRHRAVLLTWLTFLFAGRLRPQGPPRNDPMMNLYNDPPKISVIANVNGVYTLFTFSFVPYTQKYTVNETQLQAAPSGSRPIPSFDDTDFPPELVPSYPASPTNAVQQRKHDQSTQPPPDVELFPSDPWDIPLPENDFPLPDFPFPDPLEDPFDTVPAAPFPGDELDVTQFSLGDLSIFDSGGPFNFAAKPAGESKRAASTAQMFVGQFPGGIVRSRDLTTAYIALLATGQVAVVDMVAKKLQSTINLSPDAKPYSIALSYDDTTLYVAEAAPIGRIFAVDLPSGKVTQLPIAVYYASKIMLSPDGTRLWICNNARDVTVVDVLTNTIVAHLPVLAPWSVAFNRTGTRAYITSALASASGAPLNGNGTVEVYNADSYSKIASIPVGPLPHSIAVTASGRYVFVVNSWTKGSVMQISTVTNTVIRTFPTGDFTGGLAMEH